MARELPAKQVIINNNIEQTRDNLIRTQLHSKFLVHYLAQMDDESNKSVQVMEMFRRPDELKCELKMMQEQEQYLLAELVFYKKLRDQSIAARAQKEALEAYGKAPDKIKLGEAEKIGNNVMVVRDTDILNADSSASES